MDNRFNSSSGYINRKLRASVIDYAVFSRDLEVALSMSGHRERYSRLWSLFSDTIQTFPEVLKFFATLDFSIIQESGLAFDTDDVVYFRSLAQKNPDVVSLAQVFLGRFYMSRDAGFFSVPDQERAVKFRTSIYPAHVAFPERNWHGYPPPNTYNLSEAVYFFESAIAGGSTYFRAKISLQSAIKSGQVTSTYLSSFILACMKLDFLNILPCNTVEYVAAKRTLTFSDVVEDLLDMLDGMQPGMSKEINVGGVPVRLAITQARTRRVMQNYNIQNIALNRDSNDTKRLADGVGGLIDGISSDSLELSRQTRSEIARIAGVNPNFFMKALKYSLAFGVEDYEANSKIVYGNLPNKEEVNVFSGLLTIEETKESVSMLLSDVNFYDERVPFQEAPPPESDFRLREKLKHEKQASLLVSFITQLVDKTLLTQEKGAKLVIPFVKGVSHEVYKIVGDSISNVDEIVVNYAGSQIILTCL
ncbi:MAG: hypothetical protein HHAS10_05800 [Candidatus Altimarinota bacterium]